MSENVIRYGPIGLAAVLTIASSGLQVSAWISQGRAPADVVRQRTLIYVGSPGTHEAVNGAGVLVFDPKDAYRFVKRIPTWNPPAGKEPDEVRGIAASAATGLLYIATAQRLGAFDLTTDKLVWEDTYDGFCCDRMSVSPDGKVLYVPQYRGPRLIWYVIDATTGKLIKNLETPQSRGAHNTIYSLDGSRVFLEGVSSKFMSVAAGVSHTVVQTVGPFGDNVRPFTISGNGRLVFANTNNLLGFEVADVSTGKMLHHVEVTGFSTTFDRKTIAHESSPI